mmetsp:Transcript_11173/g.23535  ORF Transcript_11173/g.23535 Transcript_11173/m.23535 type:complete len:246 (-) Transcript_11173:4941-5678(-)
MSLDLKREFATVWRRNSELEDGLAKVVEDVLGASFGEMRSFGGGCVGIVLHFPLGISGVYEGPERGVEVSGFETLVVVGEWHGTGLAGIGVDARVGLVGAAGVEGEFGIASVFAAISAVKVTLGSIVATIGIAPPISDPLSIFHLTRRLIDAKVLRPSVYAKEPKRSVLSSFLCIAPVRRVLVAGILAAVSEVECAAFGVVRGPGIAGSVSEVVGFGDAASREAVDGLKSFGAGSLFFALDRLFL